MVSWPCWSQHKLPLPVGEGGGVGGSVLFHSPTPQIICTHSHTHASQFPLCCRRRPACDRSQIDLCVCCVFVVYACAADHVYKTRCEVALRFRKVADPCCRHFHLGPGDRVALLVRRWCMRWSGGVGGRGRREGDYPVVPDC